MTLAKFEATVRGDGVGKNDRVWFPKGKTKVSPTTSLPHQYAAVWHFILLQRRELHKPLGVYQFSVLFSNQ